MRIILPQEISEAKLGDLIRVNGNRNYLVIKRKNEFALLRVETMEVESSFREELPNIGKDSVVVPYSRISLKID